MNRNEAEMNTLLKGIDEDTLSEMTRIMGKMVEAQKAREAEHYREMRLSPAEAVEIIERDGGPTLPAVNFATDAFRYFRAKHLRHSAETRTLFSMGMPLEAGRIMGIRQERARRKHT